VNLAHVDQIAKALLYEGYMLYPYRPSSVKNRERFNFGVLYPQGYGDGAEPWQMSSECLVRGSTCPELEVRLRFLQLQLRSSSESPESSGSSNIWHEGLEREFALHPATIDCLTGAPYQREFEFPSQTQATAEYIRQQATLEGSVEIAAQPVAPDVYRIGVNVRNNTASHNSEPGRHEALLHSLVSVHVVLNVRNGEFISLLDPPHDLRPHVAQCQNSGWWPILVGDSDQRDTLLISPIILYDYPQIAPESTGDLFDGTEIDEILSLRILTLSDEEKKEIRQSDERARQILERTEAMPPEQFMKLHGAVRGLRPAKETAP
jgi:hypothetical protein